MQKSKPFYIFILNINVSSVNSCIEISNILILTKINILNENKQQQQNLNTILLNLMLLHFRAKFLAVNHN